MRHNRPISFFPDIFIFDYIKKRKKFWNLVIAKGERNLSATETEAK